MVPDVFLAPLASSDQPLEVAADDPRLPILEREARERIAHVCAPLSAAHVDEIVHTLAVFRLRWRLGTDSYRARPRARDAA